MTHHIGILIDTDESGIKAANYGMITLARKTDDARLTALLLDGITETEAADLASFGVDATADISMPEEPAVRLNPDLRARTLVRAVEELNIDILFGLSTAEGKDLLPRVAALKDAPLAMECMDVDPDTKTARTAQYSGKLLADIRLSGEFSVFGIRPNAVPAAKSPRPVQTYKINSAPREPGKLALVPLGEAPLDEASREDAASKDELPPLADADIVLAGGRGIQGKENFSLLFECAKKMNAAVAASRAAVDEGWISYAHQVGQTGEKVSPAVYLAFGISGSVQHFAGMKTAKTIIAVNTDEHAAIMANCDYTVQADLFEILPELIRRLK